MKTQFWAIALVVCGTLIGSWGGLLIKLAVDNMSLSLWNIIRNIKIILGVILYVISSFLFILALKGGELSVLYPLVSLSYIWVTGISYLFLHEKIGQFKIIGVCLIIIGVVFIGIGG